MAQPTSSDLPSSSDFISRLSGDSGYRQDVSGRMSNSVGDGDDYSISSKEEGYQRDDSRDLEEMAAEEGVPTEQSTKERPPIARKRVKQRVYRSEEETQIIPLSLGHYVDHSLDPVIDAPFAPLQRQANFPEILFAILSNQHLEDIITWMPHGRSFTILDRNKFVQSVLPVYFKASRMASFAKQLNAYGFVKIKQGVNQYTYYHPFFLRGLPHLVKNIKRNPTGSLSATAGHVTETDLERISAEAPVPDRVSADSTASDAIQKINHVYMLNRLREDESLQQGPVSTAPFPSPPYTSSSHVPTTSAQFRGVPTLPPPLTYQQILPMSTTTSQYRQNVAAPVFFGEYSLQPPPQPLWGGGATSWDSVNEAVRAFQAAQVQRQLQEQLNQAQLTLLANALAADLQNAQSNYPQPFLTPTQIPSTVYAPTPPPNGLGTQQKKKKGSNFTLNTEQKHGNDK
jgi:hypothetical protein